MIDLDSRLAPFWVPPVAKLIRGLPAGRYRALNLVSHLALKPFWMEMPEEKGRLHFYCDLKDAIAREVCFTGGYEPQETAFVAELLRPGMTFVDVGGNWGYYTLLAAHLTGVSGKVVSFEPDPRLFPILNHNISYNKLTHVKALQVAAADEDGLLTLAGFEENSGKRGLSRLVNDGDITGPKFQVQTRTIDAALDELCVGQVDLLKMDIEGAEELALIGMRAGLTQHRYKRILLEVHPTILAERNRTVNDVTKLLLQAGYNGWWIDHSPETIRQAAYGRVFDLSGLLKHINSPCEDAWPHTLWLAPDSEHSSV